jgi:apolipoprotein N-acyltransferase
VLTGTRAYPVVFLTGVALTLAFPEPDIAPVAWIALVPLLIALRGSRDRPCSSGRGALLGFWFGLGFFASLIYWISIVGFVAWAVLVVMEAAFLALFGLAVALGSRWRWRPGTIAVPVVAWVACEYLRAVVPVVGFTWGELAQSQHNLAWMLRPASLGGGWLVAGIVVGINVFLAGAWAHRGEARRLLASTLAGAILVGAPLLIPPNGATGDPLTDSIVKGNVPQNFTGSSFEKEQAITRSHISLLEELGDGDRPDLVVWPESSLGLDITRDAELRREVLQAVDGFGAPMIIGGNIDVDADRYKVVAFEVTPSEGITDIYEKTHLVPFGEYVPGRSLLDWIPMLDQVPRDAVPGSEHKVFDVDGHKIATVLSFEGDFGSLVRQPIAAGGRLLVVATNTSTWGDSWASAQHEAFSQVRAAENGVWVVHAALSGISAFVSPEGRVLSETELYEADTLSQPVRMAESITLYARFGDWFPWLCISLTAGCLVGAWRAPKRTEETAAEVSVA